MLSGFDKDNNLGAYLHASNCLRRIVSRKPKSTGNREISLTEIPLFLVRLYAYRYYKRVSKKLRASQFVNDTVRRQKKCMILRSGIKTEIEVLFLPDADFAIETDSTRMERCTYIFDNVCRINRFPGFMYLDNFCAMCVQSFREFVNRLFINCFGSD